MYIKAESVAAQILAIADRRDGYMITHDDNWQQMAGALNHFGWLAIRQDGRANMYCRTTPAGIDKLREIQRRNP